MCIPYDSTIHFLGIYSKEVIAQIYFESRIDITALFVLAKKKKQNINKADNRKNLNVHQ